MASDDPGLSVTNRRLLSTRRSTIVNPALHSVMKLPDIITYLRTQPVLMEISTKHSVALTVYEGLVVHTAFHD